MSDDDLTAGARPVRKDRLLENSSPTRRFCEDGETFGGKLCAETDCDADVLLRPEKRLTIFADPRDGDKRLAICEGRHDEDNVGKVVFAVLRVGTCWSKLKDQVEFKVRILTKLFTLVSITRSFAMASTSTQK